MWQKLGEFLRCLADNDRPPVVDTVIRELFDSEPPAAKNCLVFPVLMNIEQGLWEELVTVDVMLFGSFSMFRKK